MQIQPFIWSLWNDIFIWFMCRGSCSSFHYSLSDRTFLHTKTTHQTSLTQLWPQQRIVAKSLQDSFIHLPWATASHQGIWGQCQACREQQRSNLCRGARGWIESSRAPAAMREPSRPYECPVPNWGSVCTRTQECCPHPRLLHRSWLRSIGCLRASPKWYIGETFASPERNRTDQTDAWLV